MLSSLHWDLGFNPFNYVTFLLLCCDFICFIYFNHKIVVNFDFNFHYLRINKNIIKIIIIIIIIIIIMIIIIIIITIIIKIIIRIIMITIIIALVGNPFRDGVSIKILVWRHVKPNPHLL